MRTLVQRSAVLLLALACADPGAPAVSVIDPKSLLVWENREVHGESIPVVDDEAVYHLEQETHIVSAVRKTDGSLVWRRTLPVSVPGFDGYGLGLAGGVLVVGDLDLFGLDRHTGAIVWKFEPTEGAFPGFSTLFAVGDTVYCGSTTGHVYAVDASTGRQKWASQFLPANTQVFNLTVAEGVVYAGFTNWPAGKNFTLGGAVAVDATNGHVLWKTFAPQRTPTEGTENISGVAITPVSVIMGNNRGTYVLSRSTGTILATVDSAILGTSASTRIPVYTGSLIVLANAYIPSVTALDPLTLKKVWQRFVDGSAYRIASDGDYLYVAVLSGELLCLRASDGSVAWSLSGPALGHGRESFLATPAVVGDRIYVAGAGGVYALKRD